MRRAEFHPTGWMKGDCAYHALTVGSNGRIYFSVSTHVAREPAKVYEFAPETGRVRLLCRADQIVPPGDTVGQGKIHSPMTEWKGELYTTTHSSWYRQDHTDTASRTPQEPYPGGYVVAVDMQTGRGRVVAPALHGEPVTAVSGDQKIPMGGEGLIANVFDTRRGAIYVSSWPRAILARVDVASGKVTRLGCQQEKGETVAPGEPGYQRALRTLALDGRGNVYGSTAKGRIWKYDPGSGRLVAMTARMDSATQAAIPEKARHLNMWRTIVLDDRRQAFYGVHWATSWLFRYDPAEDRMEALAPWQAEHMRGAGGNPDFAQLGVAMGPGRVLYGLVHAPPTKKGVKRAVHLLTYDIDRKILTDRGEVRNAEGMALMFAESCAVSASGDVYTVGWVEAPRSLQPGLLAARHVGPAETRKLAYLMSLVRIPATGSDRK